MLCIDLAKASPIIWQNIPIGWKPTKNIVRVMKLSKLKWRQNKVNELHLFAGAGGGILGGQLLGHTTVCAVEIEEYPRQVLLQRQRDGLLPKFPIWDDVCTFDGTPWKGTVDVVCGGFPCQDLSIANPRGKGLEGSRSGLWSEMRRVIDEVQPEIVFVENSGRLISRGIGRVISDLSEIGYMGRYTLLGGHETGSCSDGKRVWIYATKANSKRREEVQAVQAFKSSSPSSSQRQFSRAIGATWDEKTDSRMRRDPNAMARGLERLKSIGNGQDPVLAATAWNILSQ
tara:strand:- start:377 stop:1234 length:858 start_codon:yes stop_codon:yes gene_type:complete